jgi:hypothetical protein
MKKRVIEAQERERVKSELEEEQKMQETYDSPKGAKRFGSFTKLISPKRHHGLVRYCTIYFEF